MDIRPDYANIIVDGQIEQVDPDDVEIGTEIREKKSLLMELLQKEIQH